MKVKVSGRGQVCLPSNYRKRANIKTGDYLIAAESGDSLILYPGNKNRDADELQQMLAKTSGIWSDMNDDGVEFVKNIRRGSNRDVW